MENNHQWILHCVYISAYEILKMHVYKNVCILSKYTLSELQLTVWLQWPESNILRNDEIIEIVHN